MVYVFIEDVYLYQFHIYIILYIFIFLSVDYLHNAELCSVGGYFVKVLKFIIRVDT